MVSLKTADAPQKPISDTYREDEVQNATSNDALGFVQSLINNPQEREKLQDATAADIVQAGKDAGYHFIESDLDALIQRFAVANTTPQAKAKSLGCHDPGGGTWDRA